MEHEDLLSFEEVAALRNGGKPSSAPAKKGAATPVKGKKKSAAPTVDL